jgi:hypothetical protein
VAWNDPRFARREFTFYDVQIGPANAARKHSQQNVPRLRIRRRNVFDLKR